MDKTVKQPLVTVLMPVYNGGSFLQEAINSILQQTFADFELLIINDGSTDDSASIVRLNNDPRIRFVENDQNIGLIATLNKGLTIATGKYIVRMDGDDVSRPERLSTQVAYMEAHPTVGGAGSFYDLMVDGKLAMMDLPVSGEELKSFLVFNCPIAHPTAILRRSLLQEKNIHYRNGFVHAEDYDLWVQISSCSDIVNIPQVLLNYRVHGSQITGNPLFLADKSVSLEKIRRQQLKLLGVDPTREQMQIHMQLCDGAKHANREFAEKAEKWLIYLGETNMKQQVFLPAMFNKHLHERWLRLCVNSFGGRKGFSYFVGSNLRRKMKLPIKQQLELFRSVVRSFKRKKIKN